MRGLLTIAVQALWASVAYAATPLAPHLSVQVARGGEQVIALRGYDLDGDALTTKITSLPASGTLFQLSFNFNEHGIGSKRGTAVKVGDTISGSSNRLVYARPTNDYTSAGKWGSFKYTVSDGISTSAEGIVTLVPSDNLGVVVSSDFSSDADGWMVAGKSTVPATYEPSSRGLLRYYIYGTENDIHVDNSGSDTAQWYFVAPNKFLGHQGITYGGSLNFQMASSTGDFSATNKNDVLDLVVLECTACAMNTGIRLVARMDSTLVFDGKATSFTLPLKETHWKKDPKNVLTTSWANPTQAEMVEVLSGLTNVKILGDHTKWHESVALDKVEFVAGSIPIYVGCSTTDPYQNCCPNAKVRQDAVATQPGAATITC